MYIYRERERKRERGGGGNTEKNMGASVYRRQKTNISKECKFNLAVWMNDTNYANDHKTA